MKRISIVFFQAIIALIGILAIAMLIWFPTIEGRAANLDVVSIYADPFILYAYVVSIAFFIGLYKTFQLLGFVGRNEIYSPKAVKTLKGIRYCAMFLIGSIVIAGVFIKIAHDKRDDPAGFLAMCILATFVLTAISVIAARLEKTLQKNAG